MLTFSVVKKIGEGSYLNDDLFIIERARRKKALISTKTSTFGSKNRLKGIKLNGKRIAS